MDETALDLNFNVIIPEPFRLENQSKSDLDKIKSEIMDKVSTWETRMTPFFNGYERAADSWRIKPSKTRNAKSKLLYNSKSGETHRAAETLATVWTRMLTASDPYFSAVAEGLSQSGLPITEEELFMSESVLVKQQRAARFKKKLLRISRSLGLMGTVVVERPFVSMPYGFGRKNIEFTDMVFRPLIRTGFDTAVCDINDSDYIFFIDFLSQWMLRNQASQDTDHWDFKLVEKHIKEFSSGQPPVNRETYSRLQSSRARAGYTDMNVQVFENISYHGRLDTENSVIQAYADSEGLQDDPKFMDWSVSILDGVDIAKFHMTQYGDWHTRAGAVTYKDFEDEPLGYGIGQSGRKLQRNMDLLESMTDDLAAWTALGMMKAGAGARYSQKQLVLEPKAIIDMEDVSQLMPLVPDPGALQRCLEMIALRREDFRNIVGAQTNLQAVKSQAGSATEAALSQTEAIRSASVHAEIIGETLLREQLEISHINNLNYLDEPIWVALTGSRKPVLVDKNKLPANIGFEIKIVTDKDFRPDRVRNLLQALQIIASGNTFLPSSLNAIRPIMKEIFRSFELNPAILNEQVPVADMMEMRMNKLANAGRIPPIDAPEGQGIEGNLGNVQETPVGPVPTSPNPGNYPIEASA